MLDDLARPIDEVAVDLNRRDIDRHPHMRRPVPRRRDGAMDDQMGERVDQARFLRDVHEFRRWYGAEFRMKPACQGFEARDTAVGAAHERLEVRFNDTVGDRLA